MKGTLPLLALGAVAVLAGCPQGPRQAEFRSLPFDGLDRVYYVYAPEDLDGTAVPLLIALHGGGGGGVSRLERAGFNEMANAQGFVVAYPEGWNEEWNDGRGVRFRDDPENTAIDDVGFIQAVVDAVAQEFPIDLKRVYVTGWSNGGMMSYRLALEAPETFAAIAPVIATQPAPLREGSSPAAAMPILIMLGTADQAVPFEGGFVFGREEFGAVDSAEQTVEFWRAVNGCVGQPAVEALPDLEPKDGSTVYVERYACTGAPVELWVVDGGGHSWPRLLNRSLVLPRRGVNHDISATQVIWSFLSQFSRP